MKHIFLYGAPGSGKSSVGRLLADSLNLPFFDLDKEIEKTAGKSIPQIMAEQGEPAFRNLESAELKKVSFGPTSVIALGGGTLLRENNRKHTESAGEVVFLDTSLPILLDRLKMETGRRPLLEGDIKEKLTDLLMRRKGHYESFQLRVTNLRNTPDEIAWEIQRKLGLFHVRGMGAGYDVVVQADGLDRLGEMLVKRGINGTVAIVADSNVLPLYGERVRESLRGAGYTAPTLTIPAGEQFKTLDTVSSLWHSFLTAGLDRKSMIVALGGGVTGDLAGFAASAFMRGIPWVGVPTSLLAMVDSSLGGKTGCDLAEGKNLIGAFHSPRLVLSDPISLSTLPEDEMRSGLGEVVKHGIIADPILFNMCAEGYAACKANLSEIVCRAMAVKIKVIEADPFESGLRAALNLGHTIGHALETVSGYRLRHGEAVAIGIVAEARLAERLGIAATGLSETIADTLLKLGLPVKVPPNLSREDIMHTMRFDKKMNSGAIHFSLPVRVGEVRVGVEVENLDLAFMEV
ncbi:MAG: 3-dehydroquinate synthase [Anaerolineales bacterium]|jgi:3-dehydroquinate synthase